MDSLASLALATEPPTEKLLQRPPVNRTASMISKQMWFNMLGQGLYQASICLWLLFHGPGYFNVPDGEVLFPADQKQEMDAQCGPGQALRMLNAAGASASDIRRFREPPAVFRARLEDVHSVSSDVVSESAAAGALALAPNTRH